MGILVVKCYNFPVCCLCLILILVTRVPLTNVYDMDCYISLNSNLSEPYRDIKIQHRIVTLYSVVREYSDCQNIVGTKLTNNCLLL